MQHFSDWYFSLVFFSAVLGVIVGAVLFFGNRNESFTSRLLSGYIFTFSILAFSYALMTTSFYLRFPNLWRALGWASFCYPVFAYLYVRSVLEQAYRFKKRDFLLFLPAVLYMLNLIPYYILPVNEKLAFLKQVFNDPSLILQEPEGLLPRRWGPWLRLLLGITATIGQVLLLKNRKKKILLTSEREQQNVTTYKWLFFFTLIQGLFYFLVLIGFILNYTGYGNNYAVIFSISGTIVFLCLYLLLKPNILYGLKNWLQEDEKKIPPVAAMENQPKAEEVSGQSKKYSLSLEQRDEFKKALEDHFSSNRPYLKIGYTISVLSQEIQLPIYQLSAFINQEYGMNFNELINEHRIGYLSATLKESPEHFQYTLEALAKMAGFNSRTAFFSAVKKQTGKTPSEFFGRGEKVIL